MNEIQSLARGTYEQKDLLVELETNVTILCVAEIVSFDTAGRID